MKSFSTVSATYMEAKVVAVRATFIIPKNFSIRFLKRILKTDRWIYFYDILDDELIGDYEKIYIYVDMFYKPMAGFLRKALQTSLSKFDEKVNKMWANDIGDELAL